MPTRKKISQFRPVYVAAALLLFAVVTFSQSGGPKTPTAFRVGERITYSVRFDKFADVAYAEIYTVSRGALSGNDAIELRSRIKTLNLISAAFYEIDEARTTFVNPESGLPLYSRKIVNPDGIARETITDNLKSPTVNFDLLSLIYKIRQSGGTGTASLLENEKVYNVTFQTSGSESVKTAAGEFETSVVTVQGDFLAELGAKELKINLSNDEAHIPVVIRLKIDRKEFRAEAASIQNMVPEPEVVATPKPAVTPTPTPIVVRTPVPYEANQPLAPELLFDLGESLEYRVTAGGRPVGSFVLRARERKQVSGRDTLVLSATATNAVSGNPVFSLNDSLTAFVDPDSLAPRQLDIKLSSGLSTLNQTVIFNDKTGSITYRGTNIVDAPIGTHSILSLIYAMRSFNLKPSKTLSNPVNDTRVAVFWESQPYVFTLRPSPDSVIETPNGKVSAQLITINTGNPQLDQLGIKVWLGNDAARMPLRFQVGVYQADLVSFSNIPPN